MTAPFDPPALQCTRHAGREAAARCPECRRFFCRECIAEYRGRLLCSECLTHATRIRTPTPRGWGWAHALGRGLALTVALGLVWMFWSWAGWQLARWQHATHQEVLWKHRPTIDAQ